VSLQLREAYIKLFTAVAKHIDAFDSAHHPLIRLWEFQAVRARVCWVRGPGCRRGHWRNQKGTCLSKRSACNTPAAPHLCVWQNAQVTHNLLFTDDAYQFGRAAAKALKVVENTPTGSDTHATAVRAAIIDCLGTMYKWFKRPWAKAGVNRIFDAASSKRLAFSKVTIPARVSSQPCVTHKCSRRRRARAATGLAPLWPRPRILTWCCLCGGVARRLRLGPTRAARHVVQHHHRAATRHAGWCGRGRWHSSTQWCFVAPPVEQGRRVPSAVQPSSPWPLCHGRHIQIVATASWSQHGEDFCLQCDGTLFSWRDK